MTSEFICGKSSMDFKTLLSSFYVDLVSSRQVTSGFHLNTSEIYLFRLQLMSILTLLLSAYKIKNLVLPQLLFFEVFL